jgi:hypothetical protein
MKAVDSHSDSLEPFFDVVPVVIVEVTAQIVTRKGSQIPASIDEKLCVGDIVFLSESMKERCRGVSPTAAEHIHLQHQFRLDVDGGVEPFLLAVNLNLFLINGDPRRCCRRRVALCLGKRLLPIPNCFITATDTQPAEDSLDPRNDSPIE